jgi:diaminohydroxyphosphoribosylaminopyrimidine deaminase/5-amino-6-(5-phosphoribosylamino)uracil reductase
VNLVLSLNASWLSLPLHVAPNPLVGAVIVHNDRIIGEGYHRQYGKAHAEVNALATVHDTSLLPHSTLYVNLEPCNHFGKTPPCSLAIIECGIKRVVISNVDPFDKVSGQGIQRLRDAGVEVVTGVLEKEGEFLNRRFFCFHRNKRPYIILKWAQSRDGFMDIDRTENQRGSFAITSPATRRMVHQWRTEENAILVGKHTALTDNPSLTVRDVAGGNPLRIAIDRNLEIPRDAHLYSNQAPTIIFHDKSLSSDHPSQMAIDFSENVIDQILAELHARNALSLIVEGGAHTLHHFIHHNTWDEARVLVGNIDLQKGLLAPVLPVLHSSRQAIGVDFLETYYSL